MNALKTIELKAFVPASDYELSKRFYQDIGFTLASDTDGIAYFHYQNVSFLLQEYYVPVLAEKLIRHLLENIMLHLLVENVDAWWVHFQQRNIAGNYGVIMHPPKQQPWGMRECLFYDPSGVLWRIAENTAGESLDWAA